MSVRTLVKSIQNIMRQDTGVDGDAQRIRLEHMQGCIDWWGGAKREGREETVHAWKVTADEIKARGYNLDIKNPHSEADDHGDPEELLADLAAAEAETVSLRNQLKAILAGALTQ